MQWFFEKHQNLDLAVNPDIPYTLDPRKPQSREKLEAIWDEAFNLLKPSTIHFGCDEIDMLGFPLNSTDLVTELWKDQIPILGGIATKHGAQMMLWGDMALAPKEAIDAQNGVSMEEAAKRRAVIPKGSFIADWHYKPESKIEAFLPSLQLWKSEGFKPVASAWSRPENVRSFDLAADVEKCGTLQTTWCGYFSNEEALIENFNQFSAMVLAADYSWSTRYDSISKLGYDPTEVFRKMYFRKARSIVTLAGTQAFFGDTAKQDLVDEDMHFKVGEPIQFRSLISAPNAPTRAGLLLSGKGRHVALLVDTMDIAEDAELLGRIHVDVTSGTSPIGLDLRYGRNIRNREDLSATPLADRVNGLCVIEMDLPSVVNIRSIQIESLSAEGGLRIHSAIIW
jgi:hypothetical protein